MDAVILREIAVEQAEELPGSELVHPFGPDWDVYKVRGKIFMLLTESVGPQMVILKSDPEDSLALREAHPDITPGYHMNKRHWITLSPGKSLDERLVRETVLDSYLLVVATLPRARRPVDPATYGGGLTR